MDGKTSVSEKQGKKARKAVVVTTQGEVYQNGEYLEESVLRPPKLRRKMSKADVTRAIADQLRDALSPRQLRFVRRAWKLQDAAQNARFRVSAALTPRREHVRMESEFIVASKAEVRALRSLARATGARCLLVMEDVGGPRKREDQYALQWDVSNLSAGRLKAKRERLMKATQMQWEAHGVGII